MTKPKAKREAPERSISTFPPAVPTKRIKPPVVRTKPDGWFTPTWPPGFVSQHQPTKGNLATGTKNSRAVQVETGSGWGTGTIPMPKTPKNQRPTWLKKEKA
jgi:hypothetical protein